MSVLVRDARVLTLAGGERPRRAHVGDLGALDRHDVLVEDDRVTRVGPTGTVGTGDQVIEAQGRPPLRGYTDIFHGEERVLHGLVVCTWAKDGLVGYEFKRDTTGGEVRPDHAPPEHSGLLTGPR